jgi:hypothetical protein
MTEEVATQEITEYRLAHQEQGYFAYSLYVLGKRFATLFGSPDYRTLVWSAHLNFEYLDFIVFQEIPRRLGGTRPFSREVGTPSFEFSSNTIANNACASFIVDADEDFVEFYLNTLEDNQQYHRFLTNVASRIEFARYDVKLQNPFGSFQYSFTAVNPSYAVTRQPEVALQLPSHRSFSRLMLEWISETTVEAEVSPGILRQLMFILPSLT